MDAESWKSFDVFHVRRERVRFETRRRTQPQFGISPVGQIIDSSPKRGDGNTSAIENHAVLITGASTGIGYGAANVLG